MKIIAIGDTHGRDAWKEITTEEAADKIIFIGDYFDSHDDISAVQQIKNFKEIMAYKKSNPEKVVLLIGNHDYHYMRGVVETYSGFQNNHAFDIREVLEDAIKENLLQICYTAEKFLFSHAGITKTWLEPLYLEYTDGDLSKHLLSICSAVNFLFSAERAAFRFLIGRNFSNTGNDITQGPLWVRPRSLFEDGLEGEITQIVGHTQHGEMIITNMAPETSKRSFAFIDCLGTSGEYLVIDSGVMIPRNIDVL